MESPAAYIPMDRRRTMARGEDLPDRTQGAALFADISGYTPLIRALVKQHGPKAGADKGTQCVNHVFEHLIAHVHRYRGSVISFNGDALTCWFDGDDGLRATACALAMQQVMAQFAQAPPFPGLTEPLGIKVAIASGPVRRFRVGDPAIRYLDVLAGNTLDRMASAEKQTETGEVVVSTEDIAQLGDSLTIAEWRPGARADERFTVVTGLRQEVEIVVSPWSDIATDRLTEEQTRPWLLPPVYERVRQGQHQLLDEYRPIVVLFMRFVGLNYDQDDSAGEKLDQYIRWVQRTLACYNGYLIKLSTGDKGSHLMATFGAPLAHDDDVNRAVAAALALRSLPPELNFICQMQIGLSRDRMLAGTFGSAIRCAYDLLGDAANMAARLMMKAASSQILATKQVEMAAASHYYFNDLGQMAIKGRSGPMRIYEVLGKQPPPLFNFATDMIGREGELARLMPLLDKAQAGQGQLLRLEGIAGVGKSCLAKAFVQRAIGRGFQIASGSCESISQAKPYHVWRQIFRLLFELTDEPPPGEPEAAWQARQIAQVGAIIRDINPDWLQLAPLLGDLFAIPIPDNETTAPFDPQLRQGALIALTLEIIQTWARDQPALILIEDAHWLDEASQVLTLALSRVMTNTALVLLVVHRSPAHQDERGLPQVGRQPGYHHLHLQPLSLPGVAAFLVERLQGQPSALVISLIQTMTQGNPFFMEQFITALYQTKGLYQRKDNTWHLSKKIFDTLRSANYLTRQAPLNQWVLAPGAQLSAADLGIPDTIHTAVLSRIDHLPESHKLTLKVASVISRPFDLALLAQAHPAQPGQEALDRQMADLEAHGLVRREAQSAPRQTYLFNHHLTQEAVYETLLPGQTPGLHRAVAEALECLYPEAVEELAYHYLRSKMRDKTLRYLDQAALKARREYANETALNYYNQALALEERWVWLQGQVELLHLLGQREAEAASLHRLMAHPDASASEVNYLWGQYYEKISNYIQAQTAIERAMAAYREANDLIGQVRCLVELGAIANRQGNYHQAKGWYNQALLSLQDKAPYADEETLILAQALNGLGIVHAQQGDLDQAEACWQRVLQLRPLNQQEKAQALNNLGISTFYQRDLVRAERYHHQAREIWRAIGDRAGEGKSLSNLGKVVRDTGDYGRALSYLAAGLKIRQVIGDRWGEANVWNDLGVVYLMTGNLSEAQCCLQQGWQVSRDIGDHGGEAYTLCNLGICHSGLIARDQKDLEAAEKLLTESLALAEMQDDDGLRAMGLSYLGIVSFHAGQLEQAIERAHKALTIRQQMKSLELMTIDLTTLAIAYLAAGDTAKALANVRHALEMLDICGGEGPEFPARDYFLCYQVLCATGQVETAQTALQAAYDLVMAQAQKVLDPMLRQSFLEQVQFNCEIVQTFRQSSFT